MAKRKKLKNVVISKEELTPTTIGYLNEKGGGMLFLLIVFGIFFVFLYFVPEINEYIEKKRGNDYSQNTPTIPDEPDVVEKQNDLGKEFDFDSKTKIIIDNLTFSNFSVDVDTISLKVKNSSDDIKNFEELEYYLYLKNSEGVIISIINLDEILLLEGKENEYSFSVDNVDISKIIIDVLKEEYLDDLAIIDNKLTCTSGGVTYIYNFMDNNLNNVTYTYNSSINDSSVNYYKNESERLKDIDGVEINIDEENDFKFELKIDLTKSDIKNIEDYYIFDKTYKPEVVNYKMQEEGYSCS